MDRDTRLGIKQLIGTFMIAREIFGRHVLMAALRFELMYRDTIKISDVGE